MHSSLFLAVMRLSPVLAILFRDFCLSNVDAEKPAALCYERMMERIPQRPEIDPLREFGWNGAILRRFPALVFRRAERSFPPIHA